MGRSLNKLTKNNHITTQLPFRVGTTFKTTSSDGKEHIDTLDHYHITDEVYVVLDLGGLLSVPIPLTDFMDKWTPYK